MLADLQHKVAVSMAIAVVVVVVPAVIESKWESHLTNGNKSFLPPACHSKAAFLSRLLYFCNFLPLFLLLSLHNFPFPLSPVIFFCCCFFHFESIKWIIIL